MEAGQVWEFVLIAVNIGLGLLMWFVQNNVTNTREDIIELRNELSHVKANYLHKDDFKEFKAELRSIFNEIKEDIRSIKESK